MSESAQHNQPYKSLGHRLKRLRQQVHESVAEVSGAVEIDPDMLARIERGEYCPSEDVLMLLLTHFDTKEEEAVRLWELAGYDQPSAGHSRSQHMPHDDIQGTKPIVMLMQPDARIIYTDMVNVTVNDQGVVMNFMQRQAGDKQGMVVSRVGMSREHAKSVLKVLEQTLAHTEQVPKSLPAPKNPPHNQ